MILSDSGIKQYMQQGLLSITPITEEQIQPASVDLTLGTSFRKMNEHQVELISLNRPVQEVSFETERVIMPPQSFLLAATEQSIELPDCLSAFVEGRSSIGRMGLFIQNAGWVDPGFKGEITLELFNANKVPIELTSGRRICQLVFAEMDRPSEKPYKGKYQHQTGAVGSMIYKDMEVKNVKQKTPFDKS
ncbi:dCTP deaminase [Alteribacter keqinensis]|uniref:dCTP deaminase, dUMP-forming n=1 Tax=Alteribacter keqinensis TaxID=2483800 RepID=A0A3M7TWC2_9BACI|nr:dCTP deaminase [Alteribacter keqinensis]RNA69960.1 dCTP deaminase [Alteribacter keqinensis]